MYRVNKYIDLLDRTLWTFLVTLPSVLIVDGVWDLEMPWTAKLATALLSALGTASKTTVAQNTGTSGMGDAIPGKAAVEEVEIKTDDAGRITAVEA